MSISPVSGNGQPSQKRKLEVPVPSEAAQVAKAALSINHLTKASDAIAPPPLVQEVMSMIVDITDQAAQFFLECMSTGRYLIRWDSHTGHVILMYKDDSSQLQQLKFTWDYLDKGASGDNRLALQTVGTPHDVIKGCTLPQFIDAVGLEKDIILQPAIWNITSDEARSLLYQEAIGTYLVRFTAMPSLLALSLRENERVVHIRFELHKNGNISMPSRGLMAPSFKQCLESFLGTSARAYEKFPFPVLPFTREEAERFLSHAEVGTSLIRRCSRPNRLAVSYVSEDIPKQIIHFTMRPLPGGRFQTLIASEKVIHASLEACLQSEGARAKITLKPMAARAD